MKSIILNIRSVFNKSYLLLFFIICLAIFLRFYQLGNIPAGFLNDEANAGYDAYSVLLTGKDQWNTFLPLTHFVGFGGAPLPVYRYLSLIYLALMNFLPDLSPLLVESYLLWLYIF
jgi:hypothetical protein